jgi:hypothetical protein
MQVIGVEKVSPRRAPNVGEHTAEVLLELGFSKAKVEALRASGAAPQAAILRYQRTLQGNPFSREEKFHEFYRSIHQLRKHYV